MIFISGISMVDIHTYFNYFNILVLKIDYFLIRELYYIIPPPDTVCNTNISTVVN